MDAKLECSLMAPSRQFDTRSKRVAFGPNRTATLQVTEPIFEYTP